MWRVVRISKRNFWKSKTAQPLIQDERRPQLIECQKKSESFAVTSIADLDVDTLGLTKFNYNVTKLCCGKDEN
jgi:hypothetical protein